MAKFRKKPVVVDAVRWDGNADTANGFMGERYGVDWEYEEGSSRITLLIPGMPVSVNVGDWIYRDKSGVLHDCSHRMFTHLYEPVD